MSEFFPMHTFDSFDIAIPSYSSAGTIEFTNTAISVQDENILSNSVCLLGSGTGFVCCKFDNDLKFEGSRVAGLILTAGHCISDVYTKKLDLIIQTNFNSDRKFDIAPSFAIPFLNFFDRNPVLSVSSIGTKYCVSNDLGLCLLMADDPSLYNEINTNPRNLSFDGKCVISGHPRKNSNSYIRPLIKKMNQLLQLSLIRLFITLDAK
jgi:hypothetical protein